MPAQRVLFYGPTPLGGLAEHVHYQARELARRGFAATVLCRNDFSKDGAAAGYRAERTLLAVRGSGIAARIGRVLAEIANRWLLALRVVTLRPAFVVLEANTEYLAAAWAWPHIVLRATGAVYLANFHDPVRARRFGPGWWHRLTLALAYAPLHGGLIHGPPPAAAFLPRRIALREAPFGAFDEIGRIPPFDLRARLGIASEAFLLLAFGHVADRKNLDLTIAALGEAPAAHLVIAGDVVSRGDRPLAAYAALAGQHGVADRVHFAAGFIPEAEIAAYFAAADAVALTYARGFVSQSGVLQIAALWDRPVLAAGGNGPLRETVERFALGVVVEPDSGLAIAQGLRTLIAERREVAAGFARYRASQSWAVNVDAMLELVASARGAARGEPLAAERG